MTNYKINKNDRKRLAWIFLGYSRRSGSHVGAPLPLVASVAESKRLDNFRFLTFGALANLASPVAHVTDGFAGLTVFMDTSALSADITNTLHGYTSFRFLDFGKSEFSLPDLTSYPTLLSASRQAKNANRNSTEFQSRRQILCSL